MALEITYPLGVLGVRNTKRIHGRVVTSTSGTISSSVCYGCSIAKTATETGRYTVTVDRTIAGQITAWNAWVTGPDDVAMTGTKGIHPILRDNDLATDGTIEIQWVDLTVATATYPDQELQDGAIFGFFFDIEDKAT